MEIIKRSTKNTKQQFIIKKSTEKKNSSGSPSYLEEGPHRGGAEGAHGAPKGPHWGPRCLMGAQVAPGRPMEAQGLMGVHGGLRGPRCPMGAQNFGAKVTHAENFKSHRDLHLLSCYLKMATGYPFKGPQGVILYRCFHTVNLLFTEFLHTF